MSCCYCWLHPCTPHCPLHKPVQCLAAIVDCIHAHHIVHYISQCHVLLLLLTASMHTTLSTTLARTMSCCYCWLHPCTPHCPLHKPVPCLAAIVDCIHAHHIVHYISQCHVLLLLLTASMHTTLSTTLARTMSCCYCWLHPCTPHCPLHKPVPCLAAIVDCIHAHHIVHYISQCHVLLLLLTASMHTTLSTT